MTRLRQPSNEYKRVVPDMLIIRSTSTSKLRLVSFSGQCQYAGYLVSES